MSLNIEHLSHSALTQFINCPTSWAARYALGRKTARGDSANFGTHYESLLAHGMGFKEALTEYQDDYGNRHKCSEEEYRTRFISPEIERAATHYFAQKWAWKTADDYQRPVEITPARWEELAAEYGANSQLPMRLIGFLDFTRKTPESKSLPEAIRASEILDQKTIGSDTWKPDWAMQGCLYALAINAPRFTIHRFVHGLPHKLAAYTIELGTLAGRALVRQTMDKVAYYAQGIKAISDDPGALEHLPRNAGYYCTWCPLKSECVSANAFESGVLGGKKLWAKADTDIPTTQHDSADSIIGGLA